MHRGSNSLLPSVEALMKLLVFDRNFNRVEHVDTTLKEY